METRETKLGYEISDVRLSFQDGSELFKINTFTIPLGEKLLLTGASGSGKSSFLHLLAGLLRPSTGDLRLRVPEGLFDIAAMSENDRADLRKNRIAVIFQKLNLIPHLTVAENIALTSPKLAGGTKLDETLERLGMAKHKNSLCGPLSTGEQQRVAVARVLLQSADIILADEPTSSLDDANTALVASALAAAAASKTLIVVSHDSRLIAAKQLAGKHLTGKHLQFDRQMNFTELVS